MKPILRDKYRKPLTDTIIEFCDHCHQVVNNLGECPSHSKCRLCGTMACSHDPHDCPDANPVYDSVTIQLADVNTAYDSHLSLKIFARNETGDWHKAIIKLDKKELKEM